MKSIDRLRVAAKRGAANNYSNFGQAIQNAVSAMPSMSPTPFDSEIPFSTEISVEDRQKLIDKADVQVGINNIEDVIKNQDNYRKSGKMKGKARREIRKNQREIKPKREEYRKTYNE
tara:strand:+ start:317 stop:667 length:351 start_codon:yes stop_codon:yes gene_type:complete